MAFQDGKTPSFSSPSQGVHSMEDLGRPVYSHWLKSNDNLLIKLNFLCARTW